MKPSEVPAVPARIRVNLLGQQFGRLTVLAYHRTGSRGKVYWKCSCKCGGISYTETQTLKRGKAKSCGCLIGEAASIRNATHGCKRGGKPTPEYSAWDSAKYRVSEYSKDAKNYFDRGIRMCDRWLESFENFLEDMGKKPSAKHSLDRIDNNGNYEPGNCRWATAKEQMANRTTTVFVEYGGVVKCVSHWAEVLGVEASTLDKRLKAGWSVAAAFTTPVRSYRKRVVTND